MGAGAKRQYRLVLGAQGLELTNHRPGGFGQAVLRRYQAARPHAALPIPSPSYNGHGPARDPPSIPPPPLRRGGACPS